MFKQFFIKTKYSHYYSLSYSITRFYITNTIHNAFRLVVRFIGYLICTCVHNFSLACLHCVLDALGIKFCRFSGTWSWNSIHYLCMYAYFISGTCIWSLGLVDGRLGKKKINRNNNDNSCSEIWANRSLLILWDLYKLYVFMSYRKYRCLYCMPLL